MPVRPRGARRTPCLAAPPALSSRPSIRSDTARTRGPGDKRKIGFDRTVRERCPATLYRDKGTRTMSPPIAVVEGTIRPDGTLELPEKLDLPAGRVQMTLVPIPDLPGDDPFWQRMTAIWAAQKSRGHVPRTE